jgi:rod shape determining protein RodA
MIDRRLIGNFDWSIPLLAVVLSLIGVVTIFSATRPVFDEAQKTFYIRQMYWIGLSIVAFVTLVMVDYHRFIRLSYFIYILGMIFLVAVLFIGRKGMGAQRWIPLGFLSFQPSEFFKVIFIIALSRYLAYTESRAGLGFREVMKVFGLFFVVPAALIMRQPDLGTAVMLFLICISMILTAGTKKKLLLWTLVIGLVTLPLAGRMAWNNLKGYQKQRIIAFIDPQADPQGVGYHITQSKVSIGSGGFWGKGYMKGTQGPYRFLPENHTDFIFSIFAEEWGFAGSMVLFTLYFLLIWRGLDTARNARDREGALLAAGVTQMFSFYVFINIGMTVGLVPVVGVPLPMMSYGGTALLSNFIALSMIENVRMRRFAHYY